MAGVLKAFQIAVRADLFTQVRRRSDDRSNEKDPSLEGYAVLAGNASCFEDAVDKVNYDAWGQPYVLRPEAIKQGEVTHFVHANHKSYT